MQINNSLELSLYQSASIVRYNRFVKQKKKNIFYQYQYQYTTFSLLLKISAYSHVMMLKQLVVLCFFSLLIPQVRKSVHMSNKSTFLRL
jgi:hypothetical protein